MKSAQRLLYASLYLIFCLIATGCSVSKHIPEDSYLLDKISIKSDDKELKTSELQGFIRQRPNNKWFSVFKVPLHMYCIAGSDSSKRFNRFMRRMGEAPVIYDREFSLKTKTNLEFAVRNQGYLNAEVELQERAKKKNMKVKYLIHPGERYTVNNLQFDVKDENVRRILHEVDYLSYLNEGMPFDINLLEAERGRINTCLHNNGYYEFNKEYIRFEADTTVGDRKVDLKMIVKPYRKDGKEDDEDHPVYQIGKVDYELQEEAHSKNGIKDKVINRAIELQEGSVYKEKEVHGTYTRLSRLGGVMSSVVHFNENPDDPRRLDARITVIPAKRHSFKAELEGTNSAGDLGAAVAVSYLNRNLFHGSEVFNLKLRGAFEAIKGLKGYQDQNFLEYNAEMGLTFPDFMFPFIKSSFRKNAKATSEVAFAYNSQDRPEFHRRVLTGSWRYRWSRHNRQLQHRVDLLDLNYVFMPWISGTFKSIYLDNPDSRNAILRYNYENLFIMKWGYSFSYSSMPLNATSSNYGTNAFTVRGAVETSGNLLYGCSSAFKMQTNNQNQYTLFNIAYAQYAKFDFDFSKSVLINKTNSLAFHVGLGVAYPYGNSKILPYEKRYFSGGANSVRGWSVRELGPGSFVGNDGRIDFINQTGDLKLDLNFEYRTHLFWKLDGAFFLDAGNIWTLREYEEQPGGQFGFDTFWKQIAVAYGLGIRLNFNYFILRLDGGMKAIHPAYSDFKRHYPLLHPVFSRDFSLNFAVGLPF